MRFRLGETLVVLASPPDEQLGYLTRTGFPVVELAREFWDGLTFAETLKVRGALSNDLVAQLDRIDAAIGVIDRSSAGGPGTPHLWTAEALREKPEWEAVRDAARSALRALGDLGVSIPALTDPDFNVRRTDAP